MSIPSTASARRPPRARHQYVSRDQSRGRSRHCALRTPLFSMKSTRLPEAANPRATSCGFCRLKSQSIDERQMMLASRNTRLLGRRLPVRGRCERAGELDRSRRRGDHDEIREREQCDSDLTAMSHHPCPVDEQPARINRRQRRGSEPPEQACAAKHGLLVEAVDDHAVVAAVEMLACEAEAADVQPMRHRGPRFVDDARARGTQLMEEKIAAAVAPDARIERVPEQYRAAKGEVVDVEPRCTVIFAMHVGE